MGRAIRWGVLSAALINEKLLAGAALSYAVDVVAVASRDDTKARALAQRWQIPAAYGSYEALLADETVDAVYIPLPNALHHEWTMRALQAGKHVLCEKPYSPRPGDVEEAFDEADRRGLILSEGFMYRYHPQIRQLARLVRDEHGIGDLAMVVASFSWPTDAPGDIRLDPTLEGGSLLDVGVYCLNASRLLAGEPASFTAQQVTGPTGVDVAFTATMRSAGGVLTHLDCGFHLPDRSLLEVVGSKGVIVVNDPWHCAEPGLTLTLPGRPPQALPTQRANSYQLQLEEFGRAVRAEANHLLGRDDAIGQARAIAGVRHAARDSA